MVLGFVFGLAFFFRVVRAFSLKGFAVLGSVLGLSDFGGPRFFLGPRCSISNCSLSTQNVRNRIFRLIYYPSQQSCPHGP